MKRTYLTILLLLCSLQISFAKQPPLKIAAAYFVPPYTMIAGNQQKFGFDIDMIRILCKSMKRECIFQSMPFGELIPTLKNNKADLAVGAIAITLPRSKEINFSKPYLPSSAAFIMHTGSKKKTPYNSIIGVEKDTIFRYELLQMGMKEENIKVYSDENIMIDALSDHDVDMVFIDTPVAKYWDRKSSGDLKIYGQPSPYAYGLGIGINPKNAKLIKDIDKALNQYLNSQDFQSNYEIYFGN